MPYSNIEQITPIMAEVLRIRPQRLIDVGCGLGVYGLLSRIQLDLYCDEKFYQKLFRKFRPQKIQWATTIDAIEGFEDYLDYLPDWVYDQIIVEDARTALPKIPDHHYDLALALAIIEHLQKEDGIRFINDLKRISRCVIISVPKQVGAQSVPDNDFETHRSNWSKEDFIDLGFHRFLAHDHAWIPVFDPDFLSIDNKLNDLPIIDRGDLKTGDKQDDLAPQLDSISENIKQLIVLQNVVLERLSIRYRLKSVLAKLSLRS